MDTKRIEQYIANLRLEEHDLNQIINLAANENLISNTAKKFMTSAYACRHQEGTSETRIIDGNTATNGCFTYRALSSFYDLENTALQSINQQLSGYHTESRLASGMHAMISTVIGASAVGDTVFSIAPEDGGHFATKSLAINVGRKSEYIPWDDKNLDINYDKLGTITKTNNASVVFLDHGTPLYPLDIAKIRDIVGNKTIIAYDASHTLGLIAGGQFQSPLEEGADILQGNTHKTFPGPQKAIITYSNSQIAQNVSNAISSGLVSNPHIHHLIALYVSILEMDEFGKRFAKQMILNADAMREALKENGISVVERPGHHQWVTSQVLIKAETISKSQRITKLLNEVGINTNSRIAFKLPTIRLGVQEVTRRGMKESEMSELAKIISHTILNRDSGQVLRGQVKALISNYTNCEYSFDEKPSIHK